MSDLLTVSDGPVLAERRDQVLLLTFNRPDRLNAWTADLERSYFDLLDAAEADTDIRAIVITGAGRGFCAGADMEDLADVAASGILTTGERPRHHPLLVRKPLIAAVNGPAAGLGLIEALYADLRIVAEGAKLTTSFARRGLIAEYGISWLLPRIVGQSRALDLLLSARVIDGHEAYRIGLADRIAPADQVLEVALNYAAELTTWSSPTSMAIIKSQVHRHALIDFDTASAESERLTAEAFERPDVREGVEAYLDRRSPLFDPLPAWDPTQTW
jgi:enoyl-CoA hydratase/carnithine racemase